MLAERLRLTIVATITASAADSCVKTWLALAHSCPLYTILYDLAWTQIDGMGISGLVFIAFSFLHIL